MILEGPMIILAVLVVTVFYPGVTFAGRWNDAAWSLKQSGKRVSSLTDSDTGMHGLEVRPKV